MSRRIRPLPVALALTGVLGALALAKTQASQFELRREALERAATDAREKLHLSLGAACQKDPTPEVTFRDPVTAHPGQSVHLVIPGTFHGTPRPLFRRDDVTATSSRLTSKGLEVDAQIAKDALPGPVELELLGELCPTGEQVFAIHVAAKTRWNVKFPNGWTVALTCDDAADRRRGGDETNCDADWAGQGGPKKVRARLRGGAEGHYTVDYQMTEAEARTVQQQMEVAMKGPPPEIQARLEKVQEAIGQCGSLPQDKQMACMQSASAEANKVSAEYEAAMKKVTPLPGPPTIGCDNTSLDVQGTSVQASGHNCGKAGESLEGGTGSVQIL